MTEEEEAHGFIEHPILRLNIVVYISCNLLPVSKLSSRRWRILHLHLGVSVV